MPRLRRITVQCRFHNGSWALFFNGLPVSTSESGRKFISLRLHKKREQAATAQSVVEIVRGELARGVAYEDLGMFKNSNNGHALPPYTVAAMIADYFQDRALHDVLEDSTVRHRKSRFGQWVTPSPENARKYGPGLGARDARGVTDADIIALVGNIRSRTNRRGHVNTKGFARLVVTELGVVFSWARLKDAEGRTISNPCHGLGEYVRDRKDKRRVDAQGERVEKVRPFTHDDEAAFLAKARERYGYEEWFFWLTLFRTGVRIGEGLALELADFRVDDAKPALHVHQTFSQGVGLHPQRKNVDDVAVHLRIWPSYLEEARRFQRHRRQQNQQRELLTPWAFSNEHGQPWAYATLHGHFGAILRAAELPHHTPHDTRHTFAVNLLDWTHDIDYVAQMLGDSLTVVVATYLKHQGARDKSEQYAGIGDQRQGAGSSRALRSV